jgi:hypothetical protein
MVYYKHAKGGNKMTIKNDWVSRSAYDRLEEDARSLRKQVYDMAGATSTAYELERRGRAKDYAEITKYRDWAYWLGVVAVAEALTIFGLVLFFVLGTH